MIWDNLHANDYDPKRIFMGPFLGRSVAIKNETSGLLLNPNCKYEANYIPVRHKKWAIFIKYYLNLRIKSA